MESAGVARFIVGLSVPELNKFQITNFSQHVKGEGQSSASAR